MKNFCHLHLHSQFSLLDGINRFDSLVARVKELGMTSCAVTDHGNLYGALDFYKEAKKGGIKPIIGMEAYITNDQDKLEENKNRDNHHLVLLAQNKKGFANLCKLISNANFNNFYYKPRININLLKENCEGLIATSACIGGWVAQGGVFLEDKHYRDPDSIALNRALELKEAFQGRFYLEIQDQEMWEQKAFNEWILAIHKGAGIPTIISADAHYLKKEDQDTHKLIMAQQLKKTLEEYEAGTEMKYGSGFYVKSPEEMLIGAKKAGLEEAAENTLQVAEECNLDFELGKYNMPLFDITKASDYDEFKRYQSTSRFECYTKVR